YYDDGSLDSAPLAPVEEDLEAIEASNTLAPQIKDSPDIRERLGWFGRGCNGDRQEGDVTERVALIERGNCAFKEKLDNAELAGAVAAVVFTDNRAVTTMGTNTGKANIVAFMITRADGLRLRDLITGGTDVEVGLSQQNKGAFDRSYMTDVISSFSSRGPSMPGAFKPNIAAPGSRINSVARGSGDGGVKLDGTSMSSPVVAGAAAVLVSRARGDGLAPDGPLTGDEGLSAIDIGALLVNGADASVWDGDARDGVPVALARGGAGRVDLSTSARLETVVRAGTRRPDTSATPFGIMFGMKIFDDVITDERPFFVRNASDEERHYTIDTTFPFPDDANSGVEFTPSEAELTLGPGEVKDLTLDLRADPATMKEWAAYGGARANWSAGMTPAEHDAYVVVTEVDPDGNPVADGDVSRLPVYLLPRGASVVGFDSESLAVSPKDGIGTATAVNTGGQPGRVDLFTLIGEDGDEGDVVDGLDIDKVGARVTEDDEGNPVVEVLVHTLGPRQAPLDTRTFVGIDTDMNGSLDYMAFTTDVSYWPSPQCQNSGANVSGPQIVVVATVGQQNPLSWSCQDWSADYFAGVDLGARSVVLPISASALGYEEGDAIAFDAIVLHTVFLPGVVPQGAATQEVAPDDGVAGTGVGPGRYHFDEDALGVHFDP
ncbi:MAG: PA domain-containing protein, partial [Anaerolineae bacterium]